MNLNVFLDTTVLLKGFAALRKDATLPLCFLDPKAKRYTFEKCVFESYMAFRGVGGKKPDEGRGKWAESNLKGKSDPPTIGKLTSQFHGGDSGLSFFWANQILEIRDRLSDFEQEAVGLVQSEEMDKLQKDIGIMHQLAEARDNFESLCEEFRNFLESYAVNVIPYCRVFDYQQGGFRQVRPALLDGFARDTALPSEDFEIVYAAMTIPADLFVTDDARLIVCASSLGLNLPISAESFCKSNKYKDKSLEFRKPSRI